jgi:hypothetical protein
MRGSMDKRGELPLQVGEKVKYNDHGLRARLCANGVVVQRLRDDYLQVLWSDTKVPTTHRAHSLIRAVSR